MTALAETEALKPRRAPAARVEIVTARPRAESGGLTIGRLVQSVLLIGLATAAFVAGVELRAWYFVESGSTEEGDPSIRFTYDINNAFNQGSAVYAAALVEARAAGRATPALGELLRAYRDRYDIVAGPAERSGQRPVRYGLDYPPARLLTMTLWVWGVRTAHPETESWVDDDLWPLLRFNTFMAALGAVGVFLLVRYWSVRAGQRGRRLPLPLSQREGVWGPSAQELDAKDSAAAPATPHPDPLAQGARGPDRGPGTLAYADRGTPSAREYTPVQSRAWDAIWGPFVAACLFWFNAALLSNAHTWPQWDVWLLPGYIWAAYFASRGWWFSAGVSIALACVFKGQILIVAPVLVLWPLFLGKIGAVVRALVGFLFAMSVMTCAWLHGGSAHGWWLVCVIGAAVAVMGAVLWGNARARRDRRGSEETVIAPRRDEGADGDAAGALQANTDGAGGTAGRWRWWGAIALGMLALLCVMWPWGVVDGGWRAVAYLTLVGVMALPIVFARNFPWGVWLAAVVAGVLFLGPVMYEGSYAWARVGFLGPTDNHRAMHMGMTFNLASILANQYGFGLDTEVEWAGMTMQRLSRVIYGVLLVLTAAGLAMHSVRRSRAALVAMVTPWLVMFAVLMQMHERYLTYAAAVSAILVGYRFGFVLLHLVITVFAVALLHHPGVNRRWWPEMYEIIHGMNPGAGWAILLLAAVFVWTSINVKHQCRNQKSE